MLKSFCDNAGLSPADLHPSAIIDYSYHLDLRKFSVLDHFLLSETMFNTSISSVYAMHDVDNTSDHEPIVLQLCLQVNLVKFIQYSDRVHMPQIAWSRASAEDCDRYRNCLSQALRGVIVPNEALHAVRLTVLMKIIFVQSM